MDFGARIYDSRIGRFLSLDPVERSFPSLSPYMHSQNNPVAMIDKGGNHAEIVIKKKSEEKGALIEKIDINVIILTTTEKNKIAKGGQINFFDYVNEQIKNTYKRKEFSGSVDKQIYKASFNINIKNELTSEQLRNELISNPVANYLTVDGEYAKSNMLLKTHASRRYINYNTTQREYIENPFPHEISHILGAEGDMFRGSYNGDRNVQDEEVNEFLTPAINLANEFKGKTIKIHFFTSTDENGNDVKDGTGKYNTYKVYDENTGEYLKSKIVPLTNPQK